MKLIVTVEFDVHPECDALEDMPEISPGIEGRRKHFVASKLRATAQAAVTYNALQLFSSNGISVVGTSTTAEWQEDQSGSAEDPE